MQRILLSNLIRWKEYCWTWPSDRLQRILLSNCKEYCRPTWWARWSPPDCAPWPKEQPLPSIGFEETSQRSRTSTCSSKLSHKVVLGSAKFFKIASRFFKTVTQGRLLFCSLLKTERGVALVHLWQGQVLGTQWWRGSQVAGLQDASDSHEVVLGSWQAVRERRTLRHTASERKLLLTKTKKYVAIC